MRTRSSLTRRGWTPSSWPAPHARRAQVPVAIERERDFAAVVPDLQREGNPRAVESAQVDVARVELETAVAADQETLDAGGTALELDAVGKRSEGRNGD